MAGLSEQLIRHARERRKAANKPPDTPKTETERAVWRVTNQRMLPGETVPEGFEYPGSTPADADSSLLNQQLGLFPHLSKKKQDTLNPSAALPDTIASIKLRLGEGADVPGDRNKLRTLLTAGKEPKTKTFDPSTAATDSTSSWKMTAADPDATPEQRAAAENKLAAYYNAGKKKQDDEPVMSITDALKHHVSKAESAEKDADKYRLSVDHEGERPEYAKEGLNIAVNEAEAHADTTRMLRRAQELGYPTKNMFFDRVKTISDMMIEYSNIADTQGVDAANQWINEASGGQYDFTDLRDWYKDLTGDGTPVQ